MTSRASWLPGADSFIDNQKTSISSPQVEWLYHSFIQHLLNNHQSGVIVLGIGVTERRGWESLPHLSVPRSNSHIEGAQ